LSSDAQQNPFPGTFCAQKEISITTKSEFMAYLIKKAMEFGVVDIKGPMG